MIIVIGLYTLYFHVKTSKTLNIFIISAYVF